MRQNRRNRPQGCLSTVALALASLTVSLVLWACFGLAVGLFEPWPMSDVACAYEPGTDGYYEVCVYGPWIEDEVDTPISQERN